MNMTGNRGLLSISIVTAVALIVVAFVWHGQPEERTTPNTIPVRPVRNLANTDEPARTHRPIEHQITIPPRISRPVNSSQHHDPRKTRPIRHTPDEIRKRNTPRF